ncbi:MAG: hypothetical protein ACOC90_11340, partial [Bacteroidota bacterium]
MSHSQVDSIPTLKNSNFNETDSLKTKSDSVEVIIPTFLGNKQRNYYGSDPPDALEIKWKRYLGKGKTVISRNIG